ncbi:MAG TPA: dihydrodipicolinate synthase family protein [Pirellulaceae bacterium]|nr:dihydrodipicolinate synthase family protein [Pirellulaceae bacterium]
MQSPLTGIVPPLVTPLLGRDQLDYAGLQRLIEHVLGGGVSGLFILGTTGEGPGLSYRLRREMIETTCQIVAQRVPVLVGITDSAIVESLAIAEWSAKCGAAAVVVAPPYYLPPGQPELQGYIERLVSELPLPLVLYNMPSLTKVAFSIPTVEALLQQPRIIGIKDSSGDMVYVHRLLRAIKSRPDWTMMIGPEELLGDAVLLGAHGGVSGGANLFPKLYVKLFQAARSGDLNRAKELHQIILRVSGSLYRIGRHPSSIIKGIKCALACLGVCDDFLAEPFRRFRPEERALVESRLQMLEAEIEKI